MLGQGERLAQIAGQRIQDIAGLAPSPR